MAKACRIPRVMIAGTGSGCGKTSVTCAILRALKDSGSDVCSFKCGPDYIDPMFHSTITGSNAYNLDPFFLSENTLNSLLVQKGAGRDINIIEGVMGFYDGLGGGTTRASAWETAKITQAPVILITDTRGTSLSVLAVIQGFLNFVPESHIKGVILNRCSAGMYQTLSEAVKDHFQGEIELLGYMPPMPDCSLENRHLGLVTPDEAEGLTEKVRKLGEQAGKTIDLPRLMDLAQSTPDLCAEPLPVRHFPEKIRIAYAKDKAFCFYYRENLELLSAMGADLVPFSPVEAESLPPDIHGLYLGGGYPELHAAALSANSPMRGSVRAALEAGLPCIAECGGYMYLTQSIDGFPMCGYLPGSCHGTGKLTRFGYIRMKAKTDNMLCDRGEEIPAHEFHYWDSDTAGDGFTAVKLSGKSWDCAFISDRLYAGFPHFHFYADPELAPRFYRACLRYKENIHVRNNRSSGY